MKSWVTVTGGEETPGYTVPKHLVQHLPYATVFVQPSLIDEELHIPALMTGQGVADLVPGLPVTTLVSGLTGRPVVVAKKGH